MMKEIKVIWSFLNGSIQAGDEKRRTDDDRINSIKWASATTMRK